MKKGNSLGFKGKWNEEINSLRFLSTLWPILQDSAHHIQDKLAISFDSSSIGLISYKRFLTIYDKYSSVKTYNEEDSIFYRKKYLFKKFQIHHLHVYFDIIPSPDIRGAFKNIASSILYHTKCTNRGKEPPCVDKRNIDHIYINCWFTVNRWSEIEKTTDNQYPPPPPPHTHTNTCKCVCV